MLLVAGVRRCVGKWRHSATHSKRCSMQKSGRCLALDNVPCGGNLWGRRICDGMANRNVTLKKKPATHPLAITVSGIQNVGKRQTSPFTVRSILLSVMSQETWRFRRNPHSLYSVHHGNIPVNTIEDWCFP